MTTTARALVDQARIRHWSFTNTQLADGAALLWINQRQRQLLLRYREEIRGLVGTSVRAASVVNGTLVGVTSGGTPYFLDSIADGYAMHLSANGVPYIDTAEDPITTDPFGQHGGTPGFPLPADVIAILMLSVTFSNGTEGPVTLVAESERVVAPQQNRTAMAFLAGNRVVPLRQAPVLTSDLWSSVTALTLSYIGLSSLTSLDSTVTLPAVMHEALIAGLADLFAKQSRDCSTAERAAFAADARTAEQELKSIGIDIVGDLQTTHVLYKG